MSKTLSGQDLDSGYAKHPGHTLSTTPMTGDVKVWRGGTLIAQSSNALELQEADYAKVYYVPRGDAVMTLLKPSGKETWCPFKGSASYFSIEIGEDVAPDAIWSYEDPFVEIGEIKDYLAFYPDQVRFEVT